MKAYELTYILSPEVSSEEAAAKAKEFEAAILSKAGVIVKQSNPIATTLSYPIKKRASGLIGVIEFQLESEKLAEIKQMTEKDGKIVRHMLIIKNPIKPRRERRGKREFVAPEIKIEHKSAKEVKAEEAPAQAQQVEKNKVELKDIEQKLDEILGD